MDTNPVFCIVSHLISLACDDGSFSVPMSPRTILTLGVREGLNRQSIPWKDDFKDVPIFRAPVPTSTRHEEPLVRELDYQQYHRWVKRLGEETGFAQVMTTYCLRRATGNAINGEPLPSGIYL